MNLKIIIALLVLVFASCNPAKQVLKHKAQFEKIGKLWASENPCVNDTITHFLKGDTVKTETVKMDSFYQELPPIYVGDTVFLTRIKEVVKYKYQTNTIHDTAINTVVDKRALNMVEKAFKDQLAISNKYEKLASVRLWMLVAAALLLIIILIIKLKI